MQLNFEEFEGQRQVFEHLVACISSVSPRLLRYVSSEGRLAATDSIPICYDISVKVSGVQRQLAMVALS